MTLQPGEVGITAEDLGALMKANPLVAAQAENMALCRMLAEAQARIAELESTTEETKEE